MAREIQRTLAIIKPDAFSSRLCGAIISEIEKSDLSLVGAKVIRLTTDQARRFYAVHTGKPFYEKLVDFMTSGPVMVLALEGPDAVAHWRTIMGDADPEQASEGTIRKLFGSTTRHNAVHGSDSPATAQTEQEFFFAPGEMI